MLSQNIDYFGFQMILKKRFKILETGDRSGNTLKQTDDNVEPPPTLAPEVPVQEVISSTFFL